MQIIDLIKELHQHELLQRVYVGRNCLLENKNIEDKNIEDKNIENTSQNGTQIRLKMKLKREAFFDENPDVSSP